MTPEKAVHAALAFALDEPSRVKFPELAQRAFGMVIDTLFVAGRASPNPEMRACAYECFTEERHVGKLNANGSFPIEVTLTFARQPPPVSWFIRLLATCPEMVIDELHRRHAKPICDRLDEVYRLAENSKRTWLEYVERDLVPTEVIPIIHKPNVIIPTYKQPARLPALTTGQMRLPAIDFEQDRLSIPLLDLYDAGGAPLVSRGKAAAMPLRITWFSVLSILVNDRREGQISFELPLHWWIQTIFPNGNYRPSRDWPRLREAFGIINSAFAITPGMSWTPLHVWKLPDFHNPNLDDLVAMTVYFPDGFAPGPQIDFQHLVKLGASPKGKGFNAAIAARALLYRPGITWVKTSKGKPVWTRELDRYPVLTPEDRRRQVYGKTDKKNRSKKEIDEAWQDDILAPAGVIVESKNARAYGRKGWRIIPAEVAKP